MLRSIKWTQIDGLISQIEHRMDVGSKFHQGTFDRLKVLKENNSGITFRIIGVQPGLSKNKLNDRVLILFQAISAYVSSFNIESVKFLISE
jgi:hypothetical protein